MGKYFHISRNNIPTIIIVILFSLCLWQLAAAGWIQAKAIIAQQLLRYSWQQTRLDPVKPASNDHTTVTGRAVIHRPWPWADTWPVAKLIVPQLGIEQIVLAGDSGSSLAFAPGYSLAGAEPNSFGTTVISAHRDTHFRFLQDIKVNDTLILQTRDQNITYRVYDLRIVDSENVVLRDDAGGRTLVLATCFPFDAISTGGSSRYLVFAEPLAP